MRLLKIFLTFFKIGIFTIGGGLAMIPMIKEEFVNNQKWMNEDDITDMLALSQALPGVIAVNASTFVGYKIAGKLGSLIATLGVIMPSFLIIFAIVQIFTAGVSSNPYVVKAFTGINASITALLFVATYKMMKGIITTKLAACIAIFSFVGIIYFKLDISIVVLCSALISFVFHSLFLPKEVNK